jgi:PadR family transcriptional regulator, regulatory protein PadR
MKQITHSVLNGLRLELRRGTLVLAVLSVLEKEGYGAGVQDSLAAVGIEIDPGALYPMLRRLETQNLLVSTWRQEDARNRRCYVLTDTGRSVLETLLAELDALSSSLARLKGNKL